jgi:hypothetical protein
MVGAGAGKAVSALRLLGRPARAGERFLTALIPAVVPSIEDMVGGVLGHLRKTVPDFIGLPTSH